MYNRNINRLTAVIQSPIAPRSTNVLWDDLVSNTLKVYRKGIWTVIGGAGGGGEGSSLYWGYDATQGVIFPLDNRSVQINGDLTVNGDITARKLSVAELEIDGKPFEQYWELDSSTNTLSTTYQVLIKNSLIVEQDTSSGGDGADTPSGGISGVKVNGVTYYDDNGDGVIDLGTISGGGSADLSNYYTKGESDARYLALSGGTITAPNKEEPLTLNSNQGQVRLLVQRYGENKSTIGWHQNYGTWMYDHTTGCSLGIRDTNGTPFYYDTAFREVIHSGNIGSYALPISGGTLDGSLTIAEYLYISNNYGIYARGNNGIAYPMARITSDNTLLYGDGYLTMGIGGYNIYLQYGYNRTNGVLLNENGNVGIGTTDLNRSNKLRIVNTHFHMFDWSLGNLAQYSDVTCEYKDTGDNSIYGLYTAINYYYGDVAMQVGRSDGLTNVYDLLLQPLGGYVGIRTYDPQYTLDVNGDISAMSALRIGGCGTTYCGLYPNSQITSGGNASRLWLYNEQGLAFYGTSLEILASTSITGNLVVSGDVASA